MGCQACLENDDRYPHTCAPAPQCDSGCQFAKDVGMENHSCSGKCQYLDHPDNQFDVVAKPKHYQFFPDVEAIDIIARSMTVTEFRGYCLGNRLKYRLRAGQKDDPKQELDKSDAYIALFERCKGLCYAE